MIWRNCETCHREAHTHLWSIHKSWRWG